MASVVPVEALTDGGHACCFYDSDEEQKSFLKPFLDEGLHSGHKIVCVADAASTRRILDAYLEDPAAEAAAASGQLVITSSEDLYLTDGSFAPERVLSCWLEETARALDEGYPGVRVTGDVTWHGRELAGVERLIEYEKALSEALAGTPSSALCQYDRRRLDDRVLAEATTAHDSTAGGCHPVSPETFRVLRESPGRYRLLGELDMAGTPTLVDVLRTAVADGAEELVLDLDGLQFMDARGATALCRPAVEAGVHVELRRPRPIVARILSILGDDRLPGVRISQTTER